MKKIVLIALAILTVFCFAGCKKESAATTTTAAAPAATATTTTTTAAAAPAKTETAEPAWEPKQPITIMNHVKVG